MPPATPQPACDAPVILEMAGVNIASERNPAQTLVAGVNWQVRAGDFWVIAGLHGSGKTDLLATASGLQRPLGGSIHLWGQDMADRHEAELLELRRQIGLVLEGSTRLFQHMTLAQNVALPWCYHQDCAPEEAADRVGSLLDRLGLTPWAHLRPGMIPPAWRHRGVLARALILEPEMLLLDKPLAGLDATHRQWWLDYLPELSPPGAKAAHRPITLVVTDDNLGSWLPVGRQFAMLKNKQWLELGDRARLQASQEPLLTELGAKD